MKGERRAVLRHVPRVGKARLGLQVIVDTGEALKDQPRDCLRFVVSPGEPGIEGRNVGPEPDREGNARFAGRLGGGREYRGGRGLVIYRRRVKVEAEIAPGK